jgi:hypothetical protein
MHLNDFPALDTSALTPIDMGTFNTGFSFNDANGVLQTVQGDTFSLTPGVTYGQIYTPPASQYSYINNLPAYSDRPLTPITMSTTTPAVTKQAPPTNTAPSTAPPPANQNVVQGQAPATSSSGSTSDWFARNIVPVLTAGIQTYGAVKQYDYAAQAAAARLPAGVSSSYLTAKAPTLTPAQIASMTPAQLQAYYAAYPSANPNLYTGTGSSILSSLGLGSMDTTTMMMLAGGSLLFFMLMRKGPETAPRRTRSARKGRK